MHVRVLVLPPQLEDLSKVSVKGQVVQAAKIPASTAYHRGDGGSRSRCVAVVVVAAVVVRVGGGRGDRALA